MIYKIFRECSSLNYSENWQCDVYIYREKICQYIPKKYCRIYIERKKKYRDCEDLPSKCTTNGNYYYYYLKLLRLICLFRVLCYLTSFSLA